MNDIDNNDFYNSDLEDNNDLEDFYNENYYIESVKWYFKNGNRDIAQKLVATGLNRFEKSNKLLQFAESIAKVSSIDKDKYKDKENNSQSMLQLLQLTKAYLEMEDTESAQKLIDKCINKIL